MVLADREKEEMDEELRHSLKGYRIEWHTRSGAPHCSSDLERVAAGQAKNIILLDNNVEVSLRSILFLRGRWAAISTPALNAYWLALSQFLCSPL